jgi:hypothetical protein
MDSDSEQMFHDLEQRHVLLRKEHDVVCVEREAFKGDQNVASTVRYYFDYYGCFEVLQEKCCIFCTTNLAIYAFIFFLKANYSLFRTQSTS